MVFITESWLSGKISDPMVNLDSKYQIFRHDRSSRGGGVCALVANDLKCVKLVLSDYDRILLEQSQCELIHFDLIFPGNKYRIILMYRPPNSSFINSELSKATKSMIDLLHNIVHPRVTTIVMGDLNLPHIEWSSSMAKDDGVHNLLLDCFLNLGMSQFVCEPTRFGSSGISNILDII